MRQTRACAKHPPSAAAPRLPSCPASADGAHLRWSPAGRRLHPVLRGYMLLAHTALQMPLLRSCCEAAVAAWLNTCTEIGSLKRRCAVVARACRKSGCASGRVLLAVIPAAPLKHDRQGSASLSILQPCRLHALGASCGMLAWRRDGGRPCVTGQLQSLASSSSRHASAKFAMKLKPQTTNLREHMTGTMPAPATLSTPGRPHPPVPDTRPGHLQHCMHRARRAAGPASRCDSQQAQGGWVSETHDTGEGRRGSPYAPSLLE